MSKEKEQREKQKFEVGAEQSAGHKNLCKNIQKEHGKTMRFVQEKFRSDSKPIWIDKG